MNRTPIQRYQETCALADLTHTQELELARADGYRAGYLAARDGERLAERWIMPAFLIGLLAGIVGTLLAASFFGGAR